MTQDEQDKCHEAALSAVRELSERAMLRPAPKHLNCGPWPPKTTVRAKVNRKELDSAWEATKKIAKMEQLRQRKMTRFQYREPFPDERYERN